MATRLIKIVAAYGLMLAAAFGFWYVLGLPRTLEESDLGRDRRLQSVSYAPFEKDQSPLDAGEKGLTISAQRIEADLALLAGRFDGIRLYSAAGLETLPPIAEKHGLKILLGAWVNSDPLATQKELARTVDLARRYPSCLQAVVVGNEALLRREVTGPQLVKYIRQVKAALPGVPVAYADVWEFWLRHPEVAPAVDLVMIHILPYWEDDPVSIDQAVEHVRKIRAELVRKIPHKKIMIGEAGWPSQGRMRAGALPSPVNQARFIRGFAAAAESEGWSYNLIEAFDQPWKRANEGAVGGYWGLYDTDRRDKSVLAGSVSNYSEWPALFALTAAIILLTLLISAPQAGLRRLQWLEFSAIGTAGAIMIVMQAHQFAVITRHDWEVVWAAMVLAQASVIYFLALWAVVSGRPPEYLDLSSTMDLLRVPKDRRPLRDLSLCQLTAVVSLTRLAGLTLALVALTGICFDSRYRSFNTWGFLLPALGYAWFARRHRSQPPTPGGGLGRLVAGALIVGALWVLIQEKPVNWQADLWAGVCLLMAFPLWREGRGGTLRPLLACGLTLAGAFAVLLALRYLILHAQLTTSLCMQDPTGVLCQIRAMLGRLMYHQVFGLISLVLAGLAVWRRSVASSLLAMVASLAAVLFYNASMGAVAFVMTGLILGHCRLVQTGPKA